MSYRSSLSKNILNTAPRVMKHALRHAPNRLLSAAMEKAFNQVFQSYLQNGELDFFAGKTLHLQVTDLDFEFFMTKPGEKLAVTFFETASDVKFSGSGDNFLLLATQEIDPDTLFFQRKLKITGDTELGLEIKNFLASLEPEEQLPSAVYKAIKLASDFIQKEKAIA